MKTDDELFSEKETKLRSEAALKRMLATPHKPHSDSKVSRKSKAKTKARRAAPKSRAT